MIRTLTHKLSGIHQNTSTPLTKPNQLKATLSAGHRPSGDISTTRAEVMPNADEIPVFVTIAHA